MTGRFQDRVDRILSRRKSLLCVGLDPDPARMPREIRRLPPARALARFNDGLLRATLPYAAAYKMQLACYLRYGAEGITELKRLAKKIGPDRIRILDLKANDIPNVMGLYRDAAFRTLGYDALTVSPWLGWETLAPLLDDDRHGFFVVAHSSNPGSQDFQEIPTPRGPLWQAVIGEVRAAAGRSGNAGVVIGATYVDAVRIARKILGNGIPILVPGVGAQGGALSTVVREGVDARGRGLLISASRSIIYASAGKEWGKAAREEAERLSTQINQLREGVGTRPSATR
ncbi:MAG: orotidine-5'-phosphate decarboxylase [Thermoplasmata archaeon]